VTTALILCEQASQSEVFKAMFSMPMAEGTPLQMEMSYTALDTFILFFYRATVNPCVMRSNVVDLLQAADKLVSMVLER
jgi:hypothetical protein